MTTSKINASDAQDAFHYCLMALGGFANGLVSTFVGKPNRGHFEVGKVPSRTVWLEQAHKTALEAGIAAGNKPRKLADAETLLVTIAEQCMAQGVNAFQGERTEQAPAPVAPVAPEWEIRIVTLTTDFGRAAQFARKTFPSREKACKAIFTLPSWCRTRNLWPAEVGAPRLPGRPEGAQKEWSDWNTYTTSRRNRAMVAQ